MTWVEFTLPKISTSMAVLIEMMPSRRTTSGLLEISCGRIRMRERNHSRLPYKESSADARRSKPHAFILNQLHHWVLEDFGVHLERGDVLIVAEGGEDRIGDIANAGLNRQDLG